MNTKEYYDELAAELKADEAAKLTDYKTRVEAIEGGTVKDAASIIVTVERGGVSRSFPYDATTRLTLRKNFSDWHEDDGARFKCSNGNMGQDLMNHLARELDEVNPALLDIVIAKALRLALANGCSATLSQNTLFGYNGDAPATRAGVVTVDLVPSPREVIEYTSGSHYALMSGAL